MKPTVYDKVLRSLQVLSAVGGFAALSSTDWQWVSFPCFAAVVIIGVWRETL